MKQPSAPSKLQVIQLTELEQMPYSEAWALQESLLRVNVGMKLAAGKKVSPHKVSTQHHMLLVEHPHVYTLGKSGDMAHVLLDEAQLAAKGIEFFKINRGGDITYHGPGQLVGYPILDLEKFKTDINWYLRSLEQAVIATLAVYGLKGERLPGATGVWLDPHGEHPRKICALGVRCSRWVTMHGFAFNINTDLGYFEHIVPCGIDDKAVTSLAAEMGRPISMTEVKEIFIQQFEQVFACQVQP